MIEVHTDNPIQLIEEIVGAISSNSIPTWVMGPASHFTLADEQWKFKAWFVPRIEYDRFVFYIIRPKGGHVTKGIYSLYHSKLLEFLLLCFDNKITDLNVSSLAAGGDAV
jgi:hypothetical protein